MTTTVIHKLITLTNRFLTAGQDKTAREIRDQLVEEVFPLLSSTMKREISNVTEYNDVLRAVEKDYPHRQYYEHEAIAMVIIRNLRRSERAARDDAELLAYATSAQRQLEPV